MSSRKQRIRVIELTLSPTKIVILWLRNAQQAGNFLGFRLGPRSPREMIAHSVDDSVRKSMKGQSEPLVQSAIQQAQQEADSLYNLIVRLNVAVLDSAEQCEREYYFLAGYMSAVINGDLTKDRIQYLRSAVLMSIEPVIILDAAIDQVVAERLSGQSALFRDSAGRLTEMLRMATDLSKWFNTLANHVGAAAIKQEDFRSSLQAEIDRTITIWVSVARFATLISVGKTEQINSALNRISLLAETGNTRD